MIGIGIYLGASVEESEDITQELLCRLTEIERREGNLDRITYKGKPNIGYIFAAMRNLYLTSKRKSKYLSMDAELPEKVVYPKSSTEIDIDMKLDKLHHYHKKLFKVYVNENHSLRSLSRATGISVSTLFYELKYIKNELRQCI